MKKNKGIIVTGGKLEANNIIVGKKSKIVQNLVKEEQKENETTTKDKAFFDSLKKRISKGELKKVVEQLLEYFKNDKEKEQLKAIIMHSASMTQLEMQENLGVITHDQAKIDRAKITNSVLQFIDDQLTK